MLISREELSHLYKRLDDLERKVAMIDLTYTVYNKHPDIPVNVPFQTVFEAIIEHLGVKPLAVPATKTNVSMCFVKETPTLNKD